MSWIIINNEIGTASNKKFTQTEFKLGTKNISMKQPAIFNNYFINSVEKVVNRVTKQDLNNDFYADDFMKYLAKSFQQPFSTINLKAVNKKEIFEIIKS